MKGYAFWLGLLLSGCSTLNENFDCPAPQGGSCQRMDEVYKKINGGSHHETSLTVIPSNNPLMIKRAQGSQSKLSEGAMRIWIAPYQDTDGNYHPSNRLYSVVKESHDMPHQPQAFKE